MSFVAIATNSVQAADWYASPNGSPSGNGSINAPWDLLTAFTAHGIIQSGDTLWLRGGTYRQPYAWAWWVNISGSPSAPIIVRHYPGEWATLDLGNLGSTFLLDNAARPGDPGNDASYVWLWGLELMCTDCPRSVSETGNLGMSADFEVHGLGVKVINCYIHDLSDGISLWQDATNAEAYGNIVVDIGYLAPDRGHGHGGYIQNTNVGTKLLSDNFFGAAFDVGLQEYGAAAQVQNLTSLDNIIWDNGAPVGQNTYQFVLGEGGNKQNMEVGANVAYTSPQYGPGFFSVGWRWDGPNTDVNIHDNFMWGPEFSVWHWTLPIVANNQIFQQSGDLGNEVFYTIYDCSAVDPCPNGVSQSFTTWQIHSNSYGAGTLAWGLTGLDANFNPTQSAGASTTDPATWRSFIAGGDSNSTFNVPVPLTVRVFPNKYEKGRANIAIVNSGLTRSVSVNLSTAGLVDGDNYAIFDAQNFRGPAVVSGVYSSAAPTVAVPMSGLVRKSIIGWSATPAHTAPAFGTFVLLGGHALDGSFSTTGSGNPPPVSVTISPSSASVQSSAKLQFSASVANSGNTAVTWTASAGTISSAGLYTAPASTGPATVTATSQADPTKFATATLMITAPNSGNPPVITFSASPLQIASGGSTTLNWTVTGATSISLQLTSNGSTISGGAQPSTRSVSLAPTATTTYTLSATGTGGTTSQSVTVTVGSSPVTVSVTPNPVSVQTGKQQQFTATVTGNSDTAVTWTASSGTISASGLYTAPSSAGSATVTATSVADATKSASATVTITAPAPPVTVSVSPNPVSVQTGKQQQFTATVTGNSNTAVNWTASSGTISTSGLYTAPSSAGSATVTATSVADATKSASATVTITAPPPPVTVNVSPNPVSVQTGKQQQFTATVTGNSNTAVTWTASSGTISTSGLYTAPSSAGSATVTATSVADGTKSAAAMVTITAAPDTIPPKVSFQSPGSNATVSGAVTVLATASDNVGVAGVQFAIDGVNYGTYMTAPPYTTSWNTAGVANGSHTLSAEAKDAAGNTAVAAISVVVSNVVAPSPGSPIATGYWSFDSATIGGGIALDQSGNGMNASMSNTSSVAGRINQALSFNGSSSYLLVSQAPLIDLVTNITLAAWVKTSGGGTEAIVSKYDSAGTEAGYLFKVNSSGVLGLRIGGANSIDKKYEAADTKKVNDGTWHHVAVVITLGQKVQFYVDGVATSSQVRNTGAATNYASFYIGGIGYNYYANNFKGSIDEVKVFNTALSASQIAQLATGN